MTTIMLSRRPETTGNSGFTLVEVMVSVTIGSIVMLGVLSTFIFLGRSGMNLRNYSDMEAQARRGLELFAEDTRQAKAVTWASADSITLDVDGVNVTYAYSSGNFTRTKNSVTTTLLSGITSFNFLAYTINGTAITDFSDATALTVANHTTKQIQISLSAARSPAGGSTATNIVLSARYVLRNKTVTA